MKRIYKKGKAIIEASIALPIVILSCIGLITFGIRFSKKLNAEIEENTILEYSLDSEPISAENMLRAKWVLVNLFDKNE